MWGTQRERERGRERERERGRGRGATSHRGDGGKEEKGVGLLV